MKHLKLFESFIMSGKKFGIFERELSDSELESQSEPTHVVVKPTNFREYGGDSGFDLQKFDLVYVDQEGDRLSVIKGDNPGMILDSIEEFGVYDCIVKIDSPEGKEFLHNHRGVIATKKFGI